MFVDYPVFKSGAVLMAVGALSVLAGCDRAAPDPRGVERDETLLTVAAIGRAEASPDQAMFTAGLSSIAADATAASTRNAEKMAQITAALANLNVAPRDIQTRNLSVNRIDYGANRGRFEASNSVSIRIRDTARAGAAIGAATAAGANILSGPTLSVSDPEKASLSAYGIAYKAARAKADAYAHAAGLRVGRVLTIRDGGEGGNMRPLAEMEERSMYTPAPVMAQAAPPPPPVMAGTNASIVTVRVDFALVPR